LINPDLLNILICPSCGSAVRDKETYIECTACKKQYPVDNGIPVLIADRAEKTKR
jgi:uncharacterized protein YbaR (Trm112 family)